MTRPSSVSVILPVRNEARFIDATIQSLLFQQATDLEVEILAVDGRSEDGTAQKLAGWSERDARVRLLDNPSRTTPAAMNIALREARSDYVCVLGAHAEYASDYIATCLRELRTHGAVGCSGRVVTRPASSSLADRLVAWCLAHPFGSSRGSVRTRAEGFVEHLAFPVFARQALMDVGGYDETLLRNQDNDMSWKLRARGGRLFLTGKTQARYFPRGGIGWLVSYAFNGGAWNAVSLRRNPGSMALHHFAPLAFVLTFLGALVIAAGLAAAGRSPRAWLVAPAGLIALHLVLGFVSSVQVAARERALSALCLPVVFLLFHFAYGAGTLSGLFADPGRSGPAVAVPAPSTCASTEVASAAARRGNGD